MISRNHQQGLTVIELLVVVIIIALLVGLLFPWGNGDRRRKAMSAMCLSNLRQTTLALALYAEDNTNAFPNLDLQRGNDGPVTLFLLSNYARNPSIFICPFVAYQRRKDHPSPENRFEPIMDRTFFISNGNDYAYYDGLSTNSVNAVVADRFAWADRGTIDKMLLNHPDRSINVGFTDGHVERVRPNILIGTNLSPIWSNTQDPLRVP